MKLTNSCHTKDRLNRVLADSLKVFTFRTCVVIFLTCLGRVESTWRSLSKSPATSLNTDSADNATLLFVGRTCTGNIADVSNYTLLISHTGV